MPPKSKINKEMIIEAAYEIVRENSLENLNARNIAKKLNCSTQPVLYCFNTMDEIKNEVYRVADEFHSEYLVMGIDKTTNPMETIGSNYIRFGYEEKNLFKFLFQSDSFSGQMQGLFDDERLTPILGILQAQLGIDSDKAKTVFAAVYYPIHGIASLLANNSIEYDEEEFKKVRNTIFSSVVKEFKGR